MRIHMSPKSSTAGHLSHSKSSRAKATAATHDLLPVPRCGTALGGRRLSVATPSSLEQSSARI